MQKVGTPSGLSPSQRNSAQVAKLSDGGGERFVQLRKLQSQR
jgi:hypothetical protein